ncbi:MAG: hypothetical protein KDA85_18825, partial [Planctomycetaceae bacterium]|nr:hypothetical protein [Planctomycetaceae bacterium]
SAMDSYCRPEGTELSSVVETTEVEKLCEVYLAMLFCQTACSMAADHFQQLSENMGNQLLSGYRSRLSSAATSLISRYSQEAAVTPALVVEFNEFLEQQHATLFSSLLRNDVPAADFANELTLLGQRFLARSQTGTQHTSGSVSSSPADVVTPPLNHVGGHHHLLTIAPADCRIDDWNRELASRFGPCVDTVHCPAEDVTTVCEVTGIDISDLIAALQKQFPKAAELSEHLHCRSDIRWT